MWLLDIPAVWRRALHLPADRQAVTAIEYALIAGLIALVIVIGVTHVGTSLSATYTRISGEL